jgi:steroid delta-isomerase-like uncharacterized protein
MCALLADDVAHDVCQGKRQTGRAAFRTFLDHMDRCYRERTRNLVVMVEPSGARAAAEFDLDGTYLATDAPHPPARGQTYTLRVGAFFDLSDGKIARIANHYNVADWLAQVR